MSTYFINPLGSETAPFDTIEKGANNYSNLFNALGGEFYDDVIEVVEGTIVDTTNNYMNNGGITLRSFSANTNNPTFSLTSGTDSTFLNGSEYDITLQGLSFVVNSEALLVGDRIMSVEECSFSAAFNPNKVTYALSGTSQNNSYTKNKFEGFHYGIYSPLTVSLIVNNNLFKDTKYPIKASGVNAAGHLVNNIEICNNSIYSFQPNGVGIEIENGNATFDYEFLFVLNNIIHGNSVSGTTGILFSGIENYYHLAHLDYNNIYLCTSAYSGFTSAGPHSITIDPKFVDPTNFDLSFAKNSGVKKTGVGPSSVSIVPITSFNGVIRYGIKTDIGAYATTYSNGGINLSATSNGEIIQMIGCSVNGNTINTLEIDSSGNLKLVNKYFSKDQTTQIASDVTVN